MEGPVLANRFSRVPDSMKPQNRLQNRWLSVVLVCALQLIAALSLISWGMDSFRNRAVTSLHNQILAQTGSAGGELKSAIERQFSGTAQAAPEQLSRWLENHVRGPLDVVALLDRESFGLTALLQGGQQIGRFSGNTALDQMTCRTVESGESCNLKETFGNPLVQSIQGVASLNGVDHLISAQSTLGGRYVLLVGQEATRITGEFMAWLPTARRVVFTTTLLVGFLAIFLNTSILQKFDGEISDIHRQLTEALLKRTRELSDTQNGVIFGLAKLAESRDNDTGDHLERIRGYVVLLANELRRDFPEIDDEFVEHLSFASSLHDIGKVGIPDAVLLKPGRLNEMERKIMEFHTVIGGECLQAIQRRLGRDEFLRMAHDIAISHHERWDGTGYPHRLSGEQIPLAARILSVADVYDALTSKRPYKAPMTHEHSCRLIREGSGTQFDARIVAAFSRRADEFRHLMEQGRMVDDDSVVPAIARLQQVLGDTPQLVVQA